MQKRIIISLLVLILLSVVALQTLNYTGYTIQTDSTNSVKGTSTLEKAVDFFSGSKQDLCGDGKINSGEQCDDGNQVTESCVYGQKSCQVCNSRCQLSTGAISFCGDKITNGKEICDGTAINGKKCTDFQGYSSGVVGCINSCTSYDLLECIRTPVCGNEIVESGEGCDCGQNGLCEGISCSDIRSGFSSGEVYCNSACTDYDDSHCSLRGVPLNVPASERTADLPDSWLVLYNSNNAESIEWKNWYIEEWGIPEENTFGLNVSNVENISDSEFRTTIFYPVKQHLVNNPSLNSRTMGIIVGYRVPGNFRKDASHPQGPTPTTYPWGGWSVSNNLADMGSATQYRRSNLLQYRPYNGQGIPNRITKEALNNIVTDIPYDYTQKPFLTARIDAPTLEQAKELTRKAKAIINGTNNLSGDYIYGDYMHSFSAGNVSNWSILKSSMENPNWGVSSLEIYPWVNFDYPANHNILLSTPNAAFRFSWYLVTGWNASNIWTNSGARVLSYALDSWGATTVRSTSAHQARAVPNALFSGGYAAAIGSTAEPFLGNEPELETILWSLHEGQTLGEAFFQANPRVNFMWELNGDPFLSVPNWFN